MQTYSQLGQDIFVTTLLNDPDFYLEIGAQHPTNINNTYLLELKGWKGISIDIIDYSQDWKIRNNKFIKTDALKTNYKNLLDWAKFPKTIGFLSLDIEGDGDRYKCLQKVLNSEYEFKIICIEHDSYRGYHETEKLPQKELLEKLGYILVVENIGDRPEFLYEDWWIHPRYIKKENYQKFVSKNIVFTNLFKNV